MTQVDSIRDQGFKLFNITYGEAHIEDLVVTRTNVRISNVKELGHDKLAQENSHTHFLLSKENTGFVLVVGLGTCLDLYTCLKIFHIFISSVKHVFHPL